MFSDPLKYVLDEYTRRYFVRSIEGHLTHLESYLAQAQKGSSINPALLYYVLVICEKATKGITLVFSVLSVCECVCVCVVVVVVVVVVQ